MKTSPIQRRARGPSGPSPAHCDTRWTRWTMLMSWTRRRRTGFGTMKVSRRRTRGRVGGRGWRVPDHARSRRGWVPRPYQELVVPRAGDGTRGASRVSPRNSTATSRGTWSPPRGSRRRFSGGKGRTRRRRRRRRRRSGRRTSDGTCRRPRRFSRRCEPPQTRTTSSGTPSGSWRPCASSSSGSTGGRYQTSWSCWRSWPSGTRTRRAGW